MFLNKEHRCCSYSVHVWWVCWIHAANNPPRLSLCMCDGGADVLHWLPKVGSEQERHRRMEEVRREEGERERWKREMGRSQSLLQTHMHTTEILPSPHSHIPTWRMQQKLEVCTYCSEWLKYIQYTLYMAVCPTFHHKLLKTTKLIVYDQLMMILYEKNSFSFSAGLPIKEPTSVPTTSDLDCAKTPTKTKCSSTSLKWQRELV